MFNNPTISQVPLPGKTVMLKSNKARYTIVAVSTEDVILQGWAPSKGGHYHNTVTLRDFAIRYEIVS